MREEYRVTNCEPGACAKSYPERGERVGRTSLLAQHRSWLHELRMAGAWHIRSLLETRTMAASANWPNTETMPSPSPRRCTFVSSRSATTFPEQPAFGIQHPASYRVLAILLAQHVRVLRRSGATTCLSQAQRQDHLRKFELYVSLPQHRKPRITEVTYTCHSGSRCHSAFTRCCSCRAACFGWGHPKLADGATQTAGRVSESSPLQQFVSSRHRAGVYGTAYERCGVS
jgi:hypothetical protein